MIGLDQALGVDVPEADYPKLLTLDDCLAYLESRFGGGFRDRVNLPMERQADVAASDLMPTSAFWRARNAPRSRTCGPPAWTGAFA